VPAKRNEVSFGIRVKGLMVRERAEKREGGNG